MKDKQLWMSQLTLFHSVAEGAVASMSRHWCLRTFGSAMILMMEEQASDTLHIIVSGTVKVSISRDGRETLLNIAGPGDMLGEVNLFGEDGHSSDITTLEPTSLFGIECEIFKEHLMAHPILAFNLARITSRRLQLATNRIEALSRLDVPRRLAQLLLSFADQYGKKGPDGSIVLPLRLTQSDLAALAGATRPRINQALTGMRNANLIEVAKNYHITLLQPEVLERLYLA